jgi:hypothetical protein
MACLVLLLAICAVLFRGALIAGLGRRSAALLADTPVSARTARKVMKRSFVALDA